MVSVCLPLMPSRNTYCLTWVSLTLVVVYLFTAAPAKCSCCSLPWMRGRYLLTAAPPDLEHGIAPLGPLCPHSHCSLEVGCSSLPPPLTSGVGKLLLASAPDLGCGASHLGLLWLDSLLSYRSCLYSNLSRKWCNILSNKDSYSFTS